MLSNPRVALKNTLAGDGRQAESLVRTLLDAAEITVGGSEPYDLQVHDDRFYGRVVRDGTLGLGESYMDGWWDCEAIDQLITRMVLARLRDRVRSSWKLMALAASARFFNMQNVRRAFEVGRRHYDIGNDLYEAMLDRHMAYTCGYWREAGDLDAAQEAKLDLVCRKIGLREGMRVLELGCGWGSFARFAAERYGAHVTGLTVSKEQVELGMRRCAGLPVKLLLEDYREASGRYDRVVSIGIMEHVGYKNYRTYMEVADRCLGRDGISFVHTIAGNKSRANADAWVHKYIFPNSVLPSLAQLGTAAEGLFVIEDLHNIGPDYDHTLMAWHRNFEAAWPELSKSPRYDDRFYRMWRYYLLLCAGGFRSRDTQLYQMVFTRTGTPQPECRFS